MKLHQKYCDDEDPENEKVGDPKTVNGKGAPKRKKTRVKSIRHCKYCQSIHHDARNCPEKPEWADEDVAVDSVSINDSSSHKQKRTKKKSRFDVGSSSRQNKC
ncbi:hypothetical protein TSUD_219490 [Trifolium subterraneum]|uniref:Uncharacterized protein n=1 Tax=Trifolium subterraneum TaxID=3900 RepID=A0A2Z6P8K2_TRISU|nr:hypothetical protein TSUD_219490 [Trifolium subterraneum]